jgi:RNA polymerase sigma factor (sigma-70 family)
MTDQPLNSDVRTRAADLYEALANPLCFRLASRFPAADPLDISDAVVDAILHVSAHLERFQQKVRPLEALLLVIARRRILTLLRSQARRRQHEQKKCSTSVTNSSPSASTSREATDTRELAQQLRAQLGLTPVEDQVLDLWLRGEKDTAVYAAVLGRGDQPAAEQEKHVRRVLARLRQRIHRLRLRLRSEESDP